MDDCQYSAGGQGVWPISVYSAEFGVVLCGSNSGAAYYDESEKDRRRAENDYKVNLKTEIMIEDLYDKVNAILAKQSALEKWLQTEDKNGRV